MSRISTSINDVIKGRCHTHICKRTNGLKTNEGIFESKIIYHECFFFSVAGVTDSKAVKGSTSMLDWTDASSSTSSIVVIVTGIAAGIVFTILLVCLFVTCRRKVNTTMSRISFSVLYYYFCEHFSILREINFVLMCLQCTPVPYNSKRFIIFFFFHDSKVGNTDFESYLVNFKVDFVLAF